MNFSQSCWGPNFLIPLTPICSSCPLHQHLFRGAFSGNDVVLDNKFIHISSWEPTYPLPKVLLKMTFHFPRWDMLVRWRVLNIKAKRGPKTKHTYDFIWSHVEIYMICINQRYCWWTKSCTSWEILNIPLFTRFCTSQVVQDFVRQQYDGFPCFTKWHICFWVMDTHWLRWTPALQTSVLKIGGLLSRLWHTIYIYPRKLQHTPTKRHTLV